MKRFFKALLIILGALSIVIMLGIGYLYFQLKTIQVKEPEEEIVNTEEIPILDENINILLVGVDTTEEDKSARSDAMMLVTLDAKEKALKLTSFARDTYVKIPGYSEEKLTHAHAYGGMNLLVQTLEDNFEVDIPYYAEIDFKSFIVAIDIIGGVDVELTEADLREFNRVSKENYDMYYEDKMSPYEVITEPGIYKLKGYQTLGFVRMRKGDNAFARDERQREIVVKLIKQISDIPTILYPKLFYSILPYIRTNMAPKEIMRLGLAAINIGTEDVRQLEFPLLDCSDGKILPGKGWVLQWDRATCLETLKKYLNN